MSAFAWHGAMMLLAWLVLLPAGALVARFYKVLPRQDYPAVTDSRVWWRAHLLLQYGATALACIGLWTAWDALGGTWDWSNAHALLGMGVMALCATQVASGWLRGTKGGPTGTHADPADPATWRGDHYDMTRRRLLFEGWHKPTGYVSLLLAVPVVCLGAELIDAPWWVQALPVLSAMVFSIAFIRLTRLGRHVDTWSAIWGPRVRSSPKIGSGQP